MSASEVDTIANYPVTSDTHASLLSHPEASTPPPDLRSDYAEVCRARDELIALTEQYHYLLDASPVAYITTNASGIIVNANQRAISMLGLRSHQIMGMATVRLADSEYRGALARHLEQADRSGECEVELRLRTSDETSVPVLLRSVPIALGEVGQGAIHSAIIDISALKQAESRLRHAHDELAVLANHDTLTGLPNRSLFVDRLNLAMQDAARHHTVSAMLFMDVDRFKVINDSLGHDVGDSLLQHVSGCLKRTVRSNDTVARMGGDEFTVILSDVVNSENAENVARKILAEINQPVSLEGHRVRPAASIGVCMFNGSVRSYRDLMKRADQAMYAAKKRGGNQIHLHDPQEHTDHLSDLERDLHVALERNEFRLRFQPQVNADGEVVAHEALVRWHHPTNGIVSPNHFIPIAEQSGFIRELGSWVLRESCLRNKLLADQHGRYLRMAVNVSPRELASAGYAESVRAILEETGHPASALELEITESAMELSEHQLERTLAALTELGVSIALDDFGTGYSSFTRLRNLPITRLKVDRSFTGAIEESDEDRRIATAIVSLAREIGLEVVAEGVESSEQLKVMVNAGCDVFQGFYFSIPRTHPAIAA
ncbi:MAG: EAL domain-containing protein [Pseudomonadota bacterium]